jgi:hypothetical protein
LIHPAFLGDLKSVLPHDVKCNPPKKKILDLSGILQPKMLLQVSKQTLSAALKISAGSGQTTESSLLPEASVSY